MNVTDQAASDAKFKMLIAEMQSEIHKLGSSPMNATDQAASDAKFKMLTAEMQSELHKRKRHSPSRGEEGSSPKNVSIQKRGSPLAPSKEGTTPRNMEETNKLFCETMCKVRSTMLEDLSISIHDTIRIETDKLPDRFKEELCLSCDLSAEEVEEQNKLLSKRDIAIRRWFCESLTSSIQEVLDVKSISMLVVNEDLQ